MQNRKFDSEEISQSMRTQALKMVHRAKASHIGSALSIIDIVAVLYAEIMVYDSQRPNWNRRDRFILSKGHACVAVYAALAECGFFKTEKLLTYGQDYSLMRDRHLPMIPQSTRQLQAPLLNQQCLKVQIFQKY